MADRRLLLKRHDTLWANRKAAHSDVHRILEAGAVDIVQPDTIKMGGITECWKALEYARQKPA